MLEISRCRSEVVDHNADEQLLWLELMAEGLDLHKTPREDSIHLLGLAV